MVEIPLDELYRDNPEFERDMKAYLPNPDVILILKEIAEQTEMVIFLGTWSPDSQSEIPKFFKVMEETDNPKFDVTVYGLDQTRQDTSGDAVAHDVVLVPTIILFRSDEELGRIVEYPKGSMESDLLDIINGHSAQR